MNILAIETATDHCSVSILNNGRSMSRLIQGIRQHAQHILPFIDSLLDESQLTLKMLDAIAVSVGPGSFVGARLGVSVAQGLALVNNLPLIPLSTLNILAQAAYQQTSDEKIIVAVDAKMGEIYWGIYELDHEKLMRAIAPDQICRPILVKEVPQGKWRGVGNAWSVYVNELLPVRQSISVILEAIAADADAMFGLAMSALAQGHTVSAMELMPVYLRTSKSWSDPIKD